MKEHKPSVSPADGNGNCTWATVALPLAPAEALRFCQDIERLLRLNPYLEIRSWQEMPGALAPGKRFHLQALNEMTGIEHDLDLTLTELSAERLCFRYSQGAKQVLELGVSPPDPATARGKSTASILTLREYYDTTAPVEVLELEVDRGIVRWGSCLHRHLRDQRRWGWLPGYGRLRRFWLSMPPRHRRIGRWLVWIGVAEFAFFLFVLIIFVLERTRP